MARMRMVKPSFFTNDTLAELDPLARLLFVGLWCLADREGRLEDRPKRIRAEILPYDDTDVDAMLQSLHDNGFILRYTHGAERYIQVVNFGKHQSPHIKEQASIIPAPDKHGASTVQAPDEHHTSPSDTDTDTDTDTYVSPIVQMVPRNHGSRSQREPLARTRTASQSHPVRNLHWDALVDVFGYEPKTKAERSKWGKAVADLKDSNATPEDIRKAKENYDRAVESGAITWTLTPFALVAHLGELLRAPNPSRPRVSQNGRSDMAVGDIPKTIAVFE